MPAARPCKRRGLNRLEAKNSPTSTNSMTATAAPLAQENLSDAEFSSMIPPTWPRSLMSWT